MSESDAGEEYLRQLEASDDQADKDLAAKIRQSQGTTVVTRADEKPLPPTQTMMDKTSYPSGKTPRKVPEY